MRVIASLAELKNRIGQEVAVSDWICVDQERIDLFAEATGDRQWIHIDRERCERESPFGQPVAHGFLTLSLLPMLMGSALSIADDGIVLNYGLNKSRFPSPLPAGSRVRARMTLSAIAEVEGGTQLAWQIVMEREGGGKPVCVAELVTRFYPRQPAVS